MKSVFPFPSICSPSVQYRFRCTYWTFWALTYKKCTFEFEDETNWCTQSNWQTDYSRHENLVNTFHLDKRHFCSKFPMSLWYFVCKFRQSEKVWNNYIIHFISSKVSAITLNCVHVSGKYSIFCLPFTQSISKLFKICF